MSQLIVERRFSTIIRQLEIREHTAKSVSDIQA